jgi:hypothetical protein
MTARLGIDRLEHRLTHFHRHIMGRLDHTESAAMAGTALDHIHRRVGDHLQHLGRFGAHILGAGMAGQMHGDAFGQGGEPSRQALLFWPRPPLFVDVEDMLLHPLYVGIVGQINAHSNFSIKPQEP